MIFTRENILTIPKVPGIYLIHNMINNKYYVGQAKDLRKRVLAHRSHYLRGNRKYPIYKALDKYQPENFEITILKTYSKNDINLQQLLDDAETKYINEYNSYGETGYNQTYGGDAGVTGYKFTAEQKKHAAEITRKINADGRFTCYVYNINTKQYEEYANLSVLNSHYGYNLHGSCIVNILSMNHLIIARTKEKLEEKINKYFNPVYYNGIEKQIPSNFLEYIKTSTVRESCKHFNISNPTYYKWLKRLTKV